MLLSPMNVTKEKYKTIDLQKNANNNSNALMNRSQNSPLREKVSMSKN